MSLFALENGTIAAGRGSRRWRAGVQRSDRGACAGTLPVAYSLIPPSNFSTRMSIAAVKTVQAHTMGSTALEKKKEPAMPAREGCRC